MGLARAVQERVNNYTSRTLSLKDSHQDEWVSNGCSWHHIANIGFYGAAMKFDSHCPGDIIMLGGTTMMAGRALRNV
jgi:hypothetical protein